MSAQKTSGNKILFELLFQNQLYKFYLDSSFSLFPSIQIEYLRNCFSRSWWLSHPLRYTLNILAPFSMMYFINPQTRILVYHVSVCSEAGQANTCCCCSNDSALYGKHLSMHWLGVAASGAYCSEMLATAHSLANIFCGTKKKVDSLIYSIKKQLRDRTGVARHF